MATRWLFGAVLAAAGVAVSPTAATAGNCCRPCGQGTVAAGGWYHYAAPQSYATPQPTAVAGSTTRVHPPAPSGSQPPVAAGNGQTIRRFSYEPETGQPVRGGGVTVTPTFAASPRPYPSSAPSAARYGGFNGNPRVGETVFRRLHPGHGWRP